MVSGPVAAQERASGRMASSRAGVSDLFAAVSENGSARPETPVRQGAAVSELSVCDSIDLGRDRWLSVRSTVGVSRLHAHRDGTPIAVPRGIVETLIDQCDGGLVRLDDGLFEGQQVRILSGPFADLVGNLKILNEAGRVQVLLQMMGSVIPVALHRSALAPAA